jgi:hypothetical protein
MAASLDKGEELLAGAGHFVRTRSAVVREEFGQDLVDAFFSGHRLLEKVFHTVGRNIGETAKADDFT